MKSKTLVLIAIFLLGLLSSCKLPWWKIHPGDKIGEMEINNNLDIGVPNFNDICSFQELAAKTCEIPSSIKKFGVSTAWVEDTQKRLDIMWDASTWKLTIDDRAVDLKAFGTFDMDIENVKARAWNIAVTNPAPGEHVVHYQITFKGKINYKENHILVFTVVESE